MKEEIDETGAKPNPDQNIEKELEESDEEIQKKTETHEHREERKRELQERRMQSTGKRAIYYSGDD